MDAFIHGAEDLIDERIAYAAANSLSARVGDTYREPTAPWRKVWHSTESRPKTSALCRTLAIQHRPPPHIWASYEHDWVGQTVPLNKSAYALFHDSGDPETNHMHAIQTEVFGFASEGYSVEKCDWLGRRVLRPLLDAGVPIDLRFTAPTTGGDGYGESGTVRGSWSWWRSFPGQCGHANVPGNVHWDPGRADYARIARAATPVPEEDADMPAVTIAVDGRQGDHYQVLNFETAVWLKDPGQVWITAVYWEAHGIPGLVPENWESAHIDRVVANPGSVPAPTWPGLQTPGA